MTSPRRRGRRDNGLDAVAFRPLRDVDPRVGEHLLDVLREAGIAAYLDPTSDVDAVTRSIALPSPPSDRLHVDRSQTDVAVALLHDYDDLDSDDPDSDIGRRRHDGAAISSSATALAADPSTSSLPSSPADDAQWSEFVAAYEADHGRLGDTLTDDFDQAARLQAAARAAAARAALAAEDAADEEHYEPPLPPPLPILSKATAYALVLLIGGALLLVAPGLLRLSGQLGFVFGVLGIASGVGMLVWRMREGPQYEDPDDGAIV
ncbi:MAG: hypothetical protein H0T54_00360 [Geodermatophilaceae bacterium]|nr:hypothetical protein [Geodermatophilaceae bacterium]